MIGITCMGSLGRITQEDIDRMNTAKSKRSIDDAEMLRLANVALRESAGSQVTQDWQEAALMVCRELVARS